MTENNNFKKYEAVWHTGFKMKVTFINISPPVKKDNEWYFIELPNGGVHETQKIEKYKNQDK